MGKLTVLPPGTRAPVPAANAEDRTPSWELLTAELHAALTPRRNSFGTDEPGSAGFEPKPAPIQLPEAIPQAWVDSAEAFMRDIRPKDEPARSVRGGVEAVEQWVLSMLSGMAHGMDEVGLDLRIEALTEDLEDFPLWCFVRDTRKRARGAFKFVPTSQELVAFIGEIDAEVRRPMRGAMQVIDAGARGPKARIDAEEPWHQRADFGWSRDAAEERGRQIAEETHRRRSEMAAAMPEDHPPAPIKQASETEEMFRTRCFDHCRTVLDKATEAMKRGNPKGGKEHYYAYSPPTPEMAAVRDRMAERARTEALELEERLAGRTKDKADDAA